MDQYSVDRYNHAFETLKANHFNISNVGYRERIKKLDRLKKAIEYNYRDEIAEALYKDLGKPKVESELTEVYQVVGEIKYAKKHLHKWMRKQSVTTPLSLLGSSSYYKYESKGVCLIISPWNFPFNLTFGPLVSAIAAGNVVVIKPSEMTPNCSALMQKIVQDVFEQNEVVLFQGEVETSTALLELPFNHIFFTGSPFVGKIVMKAAAKHLSSVTLELGGKSPTIIDKTANIDTAAKKIMWGKFLNAGQICVSPDYVLIDEQIRSQFIEFCKKWLIKYFTDLPQNSDSYGKIVNEKHFDRLVNHIEDAKSQSATLNIGGDLDRSKKYIAPTLISGLTEDATLLEDEIFGPLLPIVTYKNLTEAIEYINSKERPLALYIYSKKNSSINKIVENTRAGGTCINNNVIHYSNHNLPFGGVNNSGIGKSHGFYGFQAFSNKRAFIRQCTFGISELLFPPYNGLKEKLARLTIRWF